MSAALRWPPSESLKSNHSHSNLGDLGFDASIGTNCPQNYQNRNTSYNPVGKWAKMVKQTGARHKDHPNIINQHIPYTSLHYTTLHNITLHTLHYITLHHIASHDVALHYTTLNYTTLHYITSHDMTLRYTTFYTYIHTYIHTHTHLGTGASFR